ncbi:hypothetical protein [Thermaurantimonas aggregans]|nr:hypothetical protein [Thermaurantimonas aggregans]MCX8147789.1 hypothetical protein [Thermaurantimonas aggregans]
MKKGILLATCLLAVLHAMSQVQAPTLRELDRAIPKKADRELQVFALFYNQYVTGNYFPTNDFLRGQIFGRLFGQNTTNTSNELTATYFEQRLLPFLIYTPKLLNGKAILRTSFEIDYTWGDVAYGVGGNFGGGLSADQVNIQTQNIQLELLPFKRWSVLLGLQRMFDHPGNAYRTLFDQLTNTGYRLFYWGTDASGINVRYDGDFERMKVGFWQFYENNPQEDDDVQRFEWMYEREVARLWRVGLSADYVRDRGNGEGGPSILGQGLNSVLNEYNGTYRFPLGSAYRADIGWVGTIVNYNADHAMGPWTFNGFFNYNFGRVDTLSPAQSFHKRTSIGGFGSNIRLAYKYGQTLGDIIHLDAVYTSGDANSLADSKYSGVLTGNTWGSPVSLYISHGAYILFPHGNVVNRFVAAVTDPSNLGFGVTGLVLNVHRDFIPHKFNGKIGAASAISNVAPSGGGFLIGNELNFRIQYTPQVFMNIELHGAYLWLGDFYNSSLVNGGVNTRPVNPWTVFLVYRWLLF